MNESAAKAIDRRPIATRNRKWAQSATAWLAARNVSPNAISVAGMCACIAAGLALALTSVEYNRILWLIAALGAQLRLMANMPMAKQHRMLVITVAGLYSMVVPRPWQIFHSHDFDVGVMSFALTLIIAGCVITILRRFKRIARALK